MAMFYGLLGKGFAFLWSHIPLSRIEATECRNFTRGGAVIRMGVMRRNKLETIVMNCVLPLPFFKGFKALLGYGSNAITTPTKTIDEPPVYTRLTHCTDASKATVPIYKVGAGLLYAHSGLYEQLGFFLCSSLVFLAVFLVKMLYGKSVLFYNWLNAAWKRPSRNPETVVAILIGFFALRLDCIIVASRKPLRSTGLMILLIACSVHHRLQIFFGGLYDPNDAHVLNANLVIRLVTVASFGWFFLTTWSRHFCLEMFSWIVIASVVKERTPVTALLLVCAFDDCFGILYKPYKLEMEYRLLCGEAPYIKDDGTLNLEALIQHGDVPDRLLAYIILRQEYNMDEMDSLELCLKMEEADSRVDKVWREVGGRSGVEEQYAKFEAEYAERLVSEDTLKKQVWESLYAVVSCVCNDGSKVCMRKKVHLLVKSCNLENELFSTFLQLAWVTGMFKLASEDARNAVVEYFQENPHEWTEEISCIVFREGVLPLPRPVSARDYDSMYQVGDVWEILRLTDIGGLPMPEPAPALAAIDAVEFSAPRIDWGAVRGFLVPCLTMAKDFGLYWISLKGPVAACLVAGFECLKLQLKQAEQKDGKAEAQVETARLRMETGKVNADARVKSVELNNEGQLKRAQLNNEGQLQRTQMTTNSREIIAQEDRAAKLQHLQLVNEADLEKLKREAENRLRLLNEEYDRREKLDRLKRGLPAEDNNNNANRDNRNVRPRHDGANGAVPAILLDNGGPAPGAP